MMKDGFQLNGSKTANFSKLIETFTGKTGLILNPACKPRPFNQIDMKVIQKGLWLSIGMCIEYQITTNPGNFYAVGGAILCLVISIVIDVKRN